jgi:hypothetical protein
MATATVITAKEIQDLYDRATATELTWDDVREIVARLNELPAAEVKQIVLDTCGYPYPTKKGNINRLAYEWIGGRLEASQRTQF